MRWRHEHRSNVNARPRSGTSNGVLAPSKSALWNVRLVRIRCLAVRNKQQKTITKYVNPMPMSPFVGNGRNKKPHPHTDTQTHKHTHTHT